MDHEAKVAALGGDDEFSRLFEESLRTVKPGEVVRGKIVQMTRDLVTVDIGYKSEGQIPVHEFTDRQGNVLVSEGDEIDVYFEADDSDDGAGILLSRSKAEQAKVWRDIEKAYQSDGILLYIPAPLP